MALLINTIGDSHNLALTLANKPIWCFSQGPSSLLLGKFGNVGLL